MIITRRRKEEEKLLSEEIMTKRKIQDSNSDSFTLLRMKRTIEQNKQDEKARFSLFYFLWAFQKISRITYS